MKKEVKIILIIFAVIIMLGVVFFTVDYNRVQKQKRPIFCVMSSAYSDGGTVEYLGLGYKVIDFQVLGAGDNGENYYDKIYIGSWFMTYNSVLNGRKVSSTNLTYTIDNNMSDSYKMFSERGVFVDRFKMPDSPWIYAIAMGEQNSGGYSITIEEVNIDVNNNVEVIVKEKKPTSDDIVTQAITYPVCSLQINKEPNSVTVKNTDGEKFKNIDI